MAQRLLRIGAWGVLGILMAQTVAVRQRQLQAEQLPPKHYLYDADGLGKRIALKLEEAYTLLETGYLYSVVLDRVDAVFAANQVQVGGVTYQPGQRGPGGGFIQHTDIGPWLRVPADADIRPRPWGTGTHYGYSVVVAATWALVGIPTLATAGFWVLLLDTLGVLGCFLIARRLVPGGAVLRNACGLAGALAFSQFAPHVASATGLHWYAFPNYAALAVVAGLLATRGRFPIALGLALGLVIGVVNEIRGVMFLLPAGVAAAMFLRFGWRKAMVTGLASLLPLVAIGRIADHRVAVAAVQTHQTIPDWDFFWHVMLMGLGDFENPYGFKHEDEAAWALVRQEQPDAAYLGPAYRQVARRIFFRQVREHPLWYARLLGTRLKKVLLFEASGFGLRGGVPGLGFALPPPVAVALTVLLWPLGVGWACLRRDRAALAALTIMAYFIMVPVLTTADRPQYYLGGSTGLLLFAPAGGLALLSLAAALGRWSARRWSGVAPHLARVSRRTWRWLRGAVGPALSEAAVQPRLARTERWLRLGVTLAAAAVVARAAWSAGTLVWHNVPWSAGEGYAAAFASRDAITAGGIYGDLATVPQGFIGAPLLPLLLRGLVRVAPVSPLILARACALAAGLAMAGGAAFVVRGMGGRRLSAILAGCLVAGMPAIGGLSGLRPDVAIAAACCVWAWACMVRPARLADTGGPAPGLWAAALLASPAALPWGVVLATAGILAGRPRLAVRVLLGGGGVAALAYFVLLGPAVLEHQVAVWVATWRWWPPVALRWPGGALDVPLLGAIAVFGAVLWSIRRRKSSAMLPAAVIAGLLAGAGMALSWGPRWLVWSVLLLTALLLFLRPVAKDEKELKGMWPAAGLGLFAVCVFGGLPALAAAGPVIVAGVVAWVATGRGLSPMAGSVLAACVAAGLSHLVQPAFALPAALTALIVWAVGYWDAAAGRGAGGAVLASLVLLGQAAWWLVAGPPTQGETDRRRAREVATRVAEAREPVLAEGWYGFAASAGRPVFVHVDSLPACARAGVIHPWALLEAIEEQAFGQVLYTGDAFAQMPHVQRALLSHYAPAKRWTFNSAEGLVTVVQMTRRASPPPYESPLVW